MPSDSQANPSTIHGLQYYPQTSSCIYCVQNELDFLNNWQDVLIFEAAKKLARNRVQLVPIDWWILFRMLQVDLFETKKGRAGTLVVFICFSSSLSQALRVLPNGRVLRGATVFLG